MCTHEDTCSHTHTLYTYVSTVHTDSNNVHCHAKSWKLTTAACRASFHTDERREAFVWMNKGNLLPPLLHSPLIPIMCHHASPTCLFPSYRPRRLPILLNCLLCEVMAEEHRWERAVLAAFSCSSLAATLPKETPPETHTVPLGNYTVVLTESET